MESDNRSVPQNTPAPEPEDVPTSEPEDVPISEPEYIPTLKPEDMSAPDGDIAATEEEWRERLTPEQYEVLRKKGTEAPGSGTYLYEKARGTYHCAACGNPLFSSDAKFDSGTGWPSFDTALPGAVKEQVDDSEGMHRIEIICARCGSHLGHVFDDLPTETGKRYCMNSVCLDLEPAPEEG